MLDDSIDNLNYFDYNYAFGKSFQTDNSIHNVNISHLSIDGISETQLSHKNSKIIQNNNRNNVKCIDDFNIILRSKSNKTLESLSPFKRSLVQRNKDKAINTIEKDAKLTIKKSNTVNNNKKTSIALNTNIAIEISNNTKFNIDHNEDMILEDNKPLSSARFGNKEEDTEASGMVFTFRKNETNNSTNNQPYAKLYHIEKFKEEYLMVNETLQENNCNIQSKTILTANSTYSNCSPYGITLTTDIKNKHRPNVKYHTNRYRYIVVKKSKAKFTIERESKYIDSRDIIYSSVSDYHTLNRLSEAKAKYAEMQLNAPKNRVIKKNNMK